MDTSSAESVDHLRQRIDDEINSLQASIRALKSHRNKLAPISRLPPETLAAIFSFLPSSRFAHVCSRWRETTLNYPRLWSYINFDMLTPVGMDEILTRAMTPLHLEANVTQMSNEQFDAFKKQLNTHISRTRHLHICGALRSTLEGLPSPAPVLESLSLSQFATPEPIVPFDVFNGTTPSLTSLELVGCNISWRSPLLKGLRTLKIELAGPFPEARPNLQDWLDALDQMSQLETLVLRCASPSAPQVAPLISKPLRIVTISSLTKFHIDASAKDCVLALAHLMLPALTWLHVEAKSYEPEGEDVRLLIPYVARNVYMLQGIEQLRHILIGDCECAEVRAWTTSHDENVYCTTAPENLIFTARGSYYWHPGVDIAILDALLTLLPMNSVLTLTAPNITGLSKEFWLSQAPRWPMLEWASLSSTRIKAFSDMLAEEAPPDGPRLPSLTKLTLDYFGSHVPMVYDLRDMLIERVEQGVPLEVLELRPCLVDDHAIRLLAEVVVDVQAR